MQAKLITSSLCSATIAASISFFSLPSQAADFTATSSGKWINLEGRPDLTFTIDPDNEVRWGNPIPSNGPQSGLRFDGESDFGITIDEDFKVGTLTHFNKPIAFNSAADLARIEISLDLDGIGPQVFSFDLDINETPNGGPCPVGDIPCPDIISFPETGLAEESFFFDGMRYTLQLTSFMDGEGNNVIDFVSEEGGDNSAMLFGRITKDIRNVPEPMTIGGLGLLGIYLLSSRRSKNVG